MRKIFDQNQVAPVTLKKRRSGKFLLAFLGLVILLFGLSFIISYNMLRGETGPNRARIVELEQIVEEKDELIADLREQLLGSQPPSAAPQVTATAKPQVTISAAPKPTATKAPAATAKPTTVPTANPQPTSAPPSDMPFVNLEE